MPNPFDIAEQRMQQQQQSANSFDVAERQLGGGVAVQDNPFDVAERTLAESASLPPTLHGEGTPTVGTRHVTQGRAAPSGKAGFPRTTMYRSETDSQGDVLAKPPPITEQMIKAIDYFKRLRVPEEYATPELAKGLYAIEHTDGDIERAIRENPQLEKEISAAAPLYGRGKARRKREYEAKLPELLQKAEWLKKGSIEAKENFERNWKSLVPWFDVAKGAALKGAFDRLAENDYDKYTYERRKYPSAPTRYERETGEVTGAGEYEYETTQNRTSDWKLVDEYLTHLAEEQERGKTWGAKTTMGLAHTAVWMAEFMATSGTTTLIKAPISAAAKKLLRRSVKSAVKRGLIKMTARLTSWLAVAGTRAVILPHHTLSTYFQESLPKGFVKTPTGGIKVTKEGKTGVGAFFQAYQGAVISFAAEESGQALTGLVTKIPGIRKLARATVRKLSAAWSKSSKSVSKFEYITNQLKRAGYSNLIGEEAEEQFERVLRKATGLGGDLFPTLEEFSIEMAILAVPTAGRAAVVHASALIERLQGREDKPDYDNMRYFAEAMIEKGFATAGAEGLEVPENAPDEVWEIVYRLNKEGKIRPIKAAGPVRYAWVEPESVEQTPAEIAEGMETPRFAGAPVEGKAVYGFAPGRTPTKYGLAPGVPETPPSQPAPQPESTPPARTEETPTVERVPEKVAPEGVEGAAEAPKPAEAKELWEMTKSEFKKYALGDYLKSQADVLKYLQFNPMAEADQDIAERLTAAGAKIISRKELPIETMVSEEGDIEPQATGTLSGPIEQIYYEKDGKKKYMYVVTQRMGIDSVGQASFISTKDMGASAAATEYEKRKEAWRLESGIAAAYTSPRLKGRQADWLFVLEDAIREGHNPPIASTLALIRSTVSLDRFSAVEEGLKKGFRLTPQIISGLHNHLIEETKPGALNVGTGEKAVKEHQESFRRILRKAIDRDVSVPAAVLAEYPELAKEAKPPSATGGAGMAAAAEEGALGTIGEPAKPMGEKPPTKPVKQITDGEALDIIGGIGNAVLDPIRQLVSPGSRPGARIAAGIMRENLATLAQKADAAREALKRAKLKFAIMNKEGILDFIDRMEKGQRQDSGKLNDIADKMRKMLDGRRDIIRGMGKGYLEEYFQNYFPHIWKKPGAAKKVIAQFLGRRPLAGRKSFLKHRTIMTVADGIKLGLKLANDNPIDLVMLKLHEMDRFIMSKHLVAQLKDKGQIQFVYARSKAPDGYVPINDSIFQVYLPPDATIKTKEAYDEILVENLLSIAKSLGIKHERLMKMRGSKWGVQTGDTITTKFAGPESVITHEIGHVLGERYGLMEYVLGTRQDAYYKVGPKKGQPKRTTKTGRVKTEYADQSAEGIAKRKVLNEEWRALADLRFENKEVSDTFRKYVRKGAEKEAALLQAMIHAPERFKETAPILYKRFMRFLNLHPELHPLTELKGSMVLGVSEGNIAIPGITKLGSYYAPEPVAALINNHLSPGLRNNKNLAIASSYNLLRRMGNSLNMVQLSGSLFHMLNTGFDSIGTEMGLGIREVGVRGQRAKGLINILKSPTAPIENLWRGNKMIKAMETEMSKISDPQLRKTIRMILMGGGRAKMDPMYHLRGFDGLLKSIQQVIRGRPIQKAAGIAKMPFNVAGTAIEAISYPVLQWWVPRLKLGVMYKVVQHERARAQEYNLTDEQFRASLSRTWDSIDNRMGQLAYDNLFWNKTLKDVLMLGVRSVGWNLGSIREFAGAPVDLIKTPWRLRDGDAIVSHKMSYVMGLIITYGITGAVITYLLTGEPPDEAKDYFFPETGREMPDGSKERLSLPTYTRDAYSYSVRPWDTVKNKTHPMWGLLNETIQNETFYGAEIRNENDPVVKQITDTVNYIIKQFRPISVQNYLRMKETGAETKKAAAVSVTGITSAAAYIRRTRAHRLMIKYVIEKIPKGVRTKKQAERSKLRKQLKQQLREGEPFDSLDWGDLSNDEISRILWAAHKHPLPDLYQRLTLPQAMNVYQIANKAEKRKIAGTLISKMNRMSPDKKGYQDIRDMYDEVRKQDGILQEAEKDPAAALKYILGVGDDTAQQQERADAAIVEKVGIAKRVAKMKYPELPEKTINQQAVQSVRSKLRNAAPDYGNAQEEVRYIEGLSPENAAEKIKARYEYLVAVDKALPTHGSDFEQMQYAKVLNLAVDRKPTESKFKQARNAAYDRRTCWYLDAAGISEAEAERLLDEYNNLNMRTTGNRRKHRHKVNRMLERLRVHRQSEWSIYEQPEPVEQPVIQQPQSYLPTSGQTTAPYLQQPTPTAQPVGITQPLGDIRSAQFRGASRAKVNLALMQGDTQTAEKIAATLEQTGFRVDAVKARVRIAHAQNNFALARALTLQLT